MALIRLPTQIERLVILDLIVIVGTFKIFRIFGPVATLAQLKPAMIFFAAAILSLLSTQKSDISKVAP